MSDKNSDHYHGMATHPHTRHERTTDLVFRECRVLIGPGMVGPGRRLLRARGIDTIGHVRLPLGPRALPALLGISDLDVDGQGPPPPPPPRPAPWCPATLPTPERPPPSHVTTRRSACECPPPSSSLGQARSTTSPVSLWLPQCGRCWPSLVLGGDQCGPQRCNPPLALN